MLACGSSSCVKGYLEGFQGVDSESFWILLAAWDSLYRFEHWPEDTYISSCSSVIIDHLPKFLPFAAAMAVLTMEILASRQTYMELLIEGSHHDQSRLNLIGSQPRLFMRGRSWYETNDQSSPLRTNWNCHRIKKFSSHVIIASEASTHSLRAEAAKLVWTNKAKFYLHSAWRKSSVVVWVSPLPQSILACCL